LIIAEIDGELIEKKEDELEKSQFEIDPIITENT